ncbi:MAG TPA: flagellar biosynthesis protein FlhA [Blastocatellia bacterium]|nr:flagellar biosynthesis protein FlhA [Blastocatellia bacterium]
MAGKPQSTPKPKSSSTDWVVPLLGVAMVFVMLVPLPAVLLDLLLAASITAGVLVMLTSMYIERPVQFSVFPSLLLLLTLFRLSLNLASSRRILLHGNEGSAAAGHVIEAFGQFVVGGNYVVGFVLFIALIVIQFVVVNHGAVRIAEVTARFTLDALPGKQMAIDADLAAGLIDEQQARARREQIGREAEFYGAMDGAARFSQRDAIATILITAINIIAGFLIGVFYLNIPFQDALRTYTVLTVGDGLVTMIPSLLVSVAGGMVATRASAQASLSSDLGSQLLLRRRPLWIASGVMFTLGLIPGLPKVAFFTVSGIVGLLASRANGGASGEATSATVASGAKPAAEAAPILPRLDELSVEVGYGLVPLVDQAQGGQLLQRVKALRKHLASQLGFVVPSVHITDNPQLKPREYIVRLRGAEVARWEMYQDWLLAISSDISGQPLEGKDTREPAFGVEAKWIQSNQRERALAAGYAVVDQTSAMATHVAEVIKQHAYELLTRQETKRLLDSCSESQPKLVEELVPKVMTLGEVHRVLQQLLREQVSIRDLTTVLETMLDTAVVNKSPVFLVEAIRQALGRTLVRPFLDDEGKLTVITIDPQLEEQISQSFEPQPAGTRLAVSPAAFLKRLVDGLRNFMNGQLGSLPPTLLCGSPARFHVRRMLEPFVPKVVVLSPAEVPTAVVIQSAGVLR